MYIGLWGIFRKETGWQLSSPGHPGPCADIRCAFYARSWKYLQRRCFILELQNVLLSQWSEQWRGLLYSRYVETLLELACSAQGLKVKMSKTSCATSGSGLFGARAFEWKDVHFFYWPVVSPNLNIERYGTKKDGEGIRMTVGTSRK